jgi:hypothetical protein
MLNEDLKFIRAEIAKKCLIETLKLRLIGSQLSPFTDKTANISFDLMSHTIGAVYDC